MVKMTLIVIAIALTSCMQSEKASISIDQSSQNEKNALVNVSVNANKTENALIFINGYIENSNKMNQAVDILEWVISNNLVTVNFKSRLKSIIDKAREDEPEIGLDFDPILNAQDYPDKGFILEAFDENTNYLTVKGKDWPEFKLTMKIIQEKGNWLVDGCGVVNIPEDKRAKSQ